MGMVYYKIMGCSTDRYIVLCAVFFMRIIFFWIISLYNSQADLTIIKQTQKLGNECAGILRAG